MYNLGICFDCGKQLIYGRRGKKKERVDKGVEGAAKLNLEVDLLGLCCNVGLL